MKLDIINRFTHAVSFTAEIDCKDNASMSIKLGLAVKWAVKTGADLTRADLTGANLTRADLTGANLTGADLTGADLTRADLTGADLTGANLTGADLTRADLTGADLTGANLYEANLTGANLTGANLYGADLTGADLTGADLTGANLTRANLTDTKSADLVIARTRILPEGVLIGWKKCEDDVIVKLRIPEEAKRSHAFGRKCRAEFADVMEVLGADVGISKHDGKTKYRTGERITSDSFDDNWTEECSHGVHFWITREEAEAY